MTDTTNLDLLRRLDPLDMSTTAELDPDGATARRVHAAAIATAQRPGLVTHGVAHPRAAPRGSPSPPAEPPRWQPSPWPSACRAVATTHPPHPGPPTRARRW